MKKVLKKIKNLKIPSSLLIFLAIFAISIFGLQVSKIYAQTYSSLSEGLFLKSGAVITNNLRVSGSVGINKDASPTYKLDVNGLANFNSAVTGITPGGSQTNALATVAYVNNKIGEIPDPTCPPCPSCKSCCPTCPSCNSCCGGGGSTPPIGGSCLQYLTDISCSKTKPDQFWNPCGTGYHNFGTIEPCVGNWVIKCCPPLPMP